MLLGADCDAVGDCATDELWSVSPSPTLIMNMSTHLAPTIERKPDTCPKSLLFNGVPLAGEESKARTDGSLEYAEEEAHGQRTPVVVAGSDTAEH